MSEAYATMPSPLGELLLTAAHGRLTGLFMPGEDVVPAAGAVRDERAFGDTRRQLEEYFAGRRRWERDA